MSRIAVLCILSVTLLPAAVRAGDFAVTTTASSSYDERHGPQATLDGLMRNSFWAGRPGQKEWTLTYTFPEPARLGKVTVAFFDASGKKSHTPETVRTEITIDGKTWVALEKQPVVGAWTGGAYRPLVVEPADALMGIRFVLSRAPTGKQPAVLETQFFDTSGKLLSPGKPLAGEPGEATTQPAKPQPDADGIIVDRVTYPSTLDGTSPLTVYAQYPKDGGKLPLLVTMHGYSEPAGMYVRRTRGYAEDGFFVACVAMRGRDGSAGKHDSGGKEIHDIYDAVEFLKAKYPDRIDPRRVGIVGWSGGGGNVSASMVKLPDTFAVGVSFFGMSNYLTWEQILQRTNPKYPGPAKRLGATPAEAPNRFLARQTNLAAANNPYTRIWLLNDEQEPTCLPEMDRKYKAVADEAGLKNVTLIVTKPGDKARYRHGSSGGNLAQFNSTFLPPLKAGEFPMPTLNDKGKLLVLGFVVTKPFTIVCGSGEDAAADVEYAIDGETLTFTSKARSSDSQKPIEIRLPKAKYASITKATVNGQPVEPGRTALHHVVTAPSLNARIQVDAKRAP